MQKKPATKHDSLESEFDLAHSSTKGAIERESALAEYAPPARKKAETIAVKSSRSKPSESASHVPGARVTPEYIERTPQMWAVGEVDIKAIRDDSLVANVSWTIGGFLLGIAVNIFVSSAAADKLTPIGSLMLKEAAPVLCALAIVFAVLGIVMNRKRDAIWKQIKKESKPR
jgi:hypothetical protein